MNRIIASSWLKYLAISLLTAAWLLYSGWQAADFWAEAANELSVFATIFLGIFIEAAPFLLLGTLASGFTEIFLRSEWLIAILPRRAMYAALGGALLGLFFPVCECGVVPFTRRLFRKGLPVSAGVAFLLAAPALNPIAIFGTIAAFGWGEVLFWRIALTLLIAIVTALIFSLEPNPARLLRLADVTQNDLQAPHHNHHHHDHDHHHHDHPQTLSQKLFASLLIAADEFLEMGRYLVFGAALAAAMQTLVPQTALLTLGKTPLSSTLVMLLLAVLLSICSTVDSFVALGFLSTFNIGSITAFLVFGPMVDIKSTLMYLRVFRIRPTVYMLLLPFLMSLLAGLLLNLYR